MIVVFKDFANHRKFHVLHVAVVILKLVGNVEKLIMDLRHDLLERFELHRGADTGDDILALRVHQDLSVEFILACGRVTCESHT